ncbi:MAG: metalloprotease TldD [Hyphomicrobiales bacterium]|nr:metalloprotease TldD [Hyphomicrobiales bacterium]
MKPLLEHFDIDQAAIQRMVGDAVGGGDDGELFMEYRQSEGLVFDNGKLKSGGFSTDLGFGLRAINGETSAFAHSGEISQQALKRACEAVRTVHTGRSGQYSEAPGRTNRNLYGEENPLGSPDFEEKVKILEQIDSYARAKDERVRQVSASIAGNWQVVEILRADGHLVRDVRPLVRLNVSIVVGKGEQQETGSYGMGGRRGFGEFLAEESWKSAVDAALKQALVNLEAVPAPAGTFDVVLGPGWPGVMLHEAVGHGLEGDFNRKKTSAFAGLMGKQVAAKGVTVVDDGTINERRGSLSVDDEGTPTENTVLIENGILVGYMQDRQNARLMGMKPTGNGRRESYSHSPMPRMTNTYMLGGDMQPDEIITSVKNGIYAVAFGGGQVDITSGKFVFDCTEAYEIRNGKIESPLKGANLIGNGPEAMKRVSMIGNDMALDNGVGVCGKAGQGVPVGVGQPTLRMDQMTIGGTGV